MAMNVTDIRDLKTAMAYFKQEWHAGRYIEQDAELILMASGEPGKTGRRMAAYQKAHPLGRIGRRARNT